MNRRFMLLLLILASCGLLSFPAFSQDPPTPESSAAEYGAWADANPRSADAALNAGLRFVDADQLGMALVYLERARLMAPLDREIEDALQTVAREARHRRAEEAGDETITEGEPDAMAWFRFFHVMRPTAYRWLLLMAVWMSALLCVAWRRMTPGVARDAVLVATLLSGVTAASAAFFTAGAAWSEANIAPAVIVVDAPLYREAPDELSPQRRHTDLFEGALVKVLERRGEEWVHIEIAGGETLWVAPASLVEIR